MKNGIKTTRKPRQGYKFKDTKEGLRDIEALRKKINESNGELKYQALIDHWQNLSSSPEFISGSNPRPINGEGEEL